MKLRQAVFGVLATAAALTTEMAVADSCIASGSTERLPVSSASGTMAVDFLSGYDWMFDFGWAPLSTMFYSDNPGMSIILR